MADILHISDNEGGLSVRNKLNSVIDKVNASDIESFGSKYSAMDAGVRGDMSIDDDFLYICVESGEIGFARWKRIPLKQI